MIGMMMMTFVLFFAFVVNTGMLVNAKINLQNAADLAAYSGASVQARTLNQISFLNYEMRRQYKKFLFRYYVMGNMAQDPFPRTQGGGSGKSAPQWGPASNMDYGLPTVCMIFNPVDNYCHISELPQISIPPPNKVDAVNETLISHLKAIETIRQQSCMSIGATNTAVLGLWLWNTDPSLETLADSFPNPNMQKTVSIIRGLAYGLGLVPREMILRQRIRTLNDYVNAPAARGVSFAKISAMKSGADPAAQERTIEAFLSAFYTLGNNTFDAENITMDELTPASLLALKDIKAKFSTYAVKFDINGGKADGEKADDCHPTIEANQLKNEAIFGVYKDPTVLTYYALRLKATAKLMFSPFPDLELKAYAAAQPFGSRIGPALTDSDWTHPATHINPELTKGASGSDLLNASPIPNLAIREGDSAAEANGWDTREALGAYYQKFAPDATGAAITNIDSAAIEQAYHAAMAPNPYEVNKYNIPTDLGNDPFVRNFDSSQNNVFWAPLFAPGNPVSANDQMKQMIDSVLSDKDVDMKAAILKELNAYIAKLRTGQGENQGGVGESFNVARIMDPTTAGGPGGSRTPINVTGMTETDPVKLKTSWNAVLNGAFRKEGRTGYSVKFVSFESLMNGSIKTDGKTAPSNPVAQDSDADGDLALIRH
jgi:hypothetical protein